MTRRERSRYELREEMPATLGAVERFCARMRQWGDAVGLGQSFAAELLVREALNNAVLHGSKADPSKRVVCLLRWRATRLTIAVRDEGCGFDWRGAQQRHADTDSTSGRGLWLFEAYANRVRFGGRGNSVVIVKVLNED